MFVGNYAVVSCDWKNYFPFLAVFLLSTHAGLIPAQDWIELGANCTDCLEYNEISWYTQLKSFHGAFK